MCLTAKNVGLEEENIRLTEKEREREREDAEAL